MDCFIYQEYRYEREACCRRHNVGVGVNMYSFIIYVHAIFMSASSRQDSHRLNFDITGCLSQADAPTCLTEQQRHFQSRGRKGWICPVHSSVHWDCLVNIHCRAMILLFLAPPPHRVIGAHNSSYHKCPIICKTFLLDLESQAGIVF